MHQVGVGTKLLLGRVDAACSWTEHELSPMADMRVAQGPGSLSKNGPKTQTRGLLYLFKDKTRKGFRQLVLSVYQEQLIKKWVFTTKEVA